MFDKMKQLMEMKKQADQIKRDLDGLNIECSDVNGIKVSVNGSLQFKSIEISETLLKPENKKRLESDILRSLNSAIKKAQNQAAEKMKHLLPSGFPGL